MKCAAKPGLCVALAVLLLVPEAAHAFRCKNKLVRDGMHEQEVIAICGEPVTRRHLGVAVRGYPYAWSTVGPGTAQRYSTAYGVLSEEVLITEYVYNFGPRKLMRRLVFEGGVLVDIESLGYGYTEKTGKD